MGSGDHCPVRDQESNARRTLIPRRFANNKFPNQKKLFQGDVVYVNGKELKVLRSDPIRKVVTVDLEGEMCFNIWEVDGNKPLEEAPTVAGE